MPQALRAGTDTYWTQFGTGPRPGLLIHCCLASSQAWVPLALRLADTLTMTAFDMPGHGKSGPFDPGGEIQEITTNVAATFLDAVPLDVIGHSFGATVALRLAIEHPGLVRSLTMIEPVFFAVGIADQPKIGLEHAKLSAGFGLAMAEGDHREAARVFTGIWGEGTPFSKLPEAEQEVLAKQMPLIEATEAALFDDVGNLMRPDRMARASMPALLLRGTRSPAIIPAICDGLCHRLPNAHCVDIPGAGHMAPLTHPAAVGDEILRFLAA